MADLLDILPDFDVKSFSHLMHSLNKNEITVTDLVTLDPIEIVRKCPLPVLDVKRLVREVIEALQKDVGTNLNTPHSDTAGLALERGKANMQSIRSDSFPGAKQGSKVKTLDPIIDELLCGGFMTGHITEVVGESSAGKTQFVLGLLLSVQLPPPQGLGRNAIYLSTESPLRTDRLVELIRSHPIYQTLPAAECPTTDRIRTVSLQSLELQQHIVEWQLPARIEEHNVGLIVMDSAAANFRAESETKTPSGLADRATELNRLGFLLRKVAIDYNVAVVVTNQVADRFDTPNARTNLDRLYSSSPAAPSSQLGSPASVSINKTNTLAKGVVSLDHQQKFFTGWGDKIIASNENLKTPALGLAWANQISGRVALKIEGTRRRAIDYSGGHVWTDGKRRRFVKMVFAPWASPCVKPVEYEILSQGITSIKPTNNPEISITSQHVELLADELWSEDEEYP